jgi:hypothetical protein
MTRRQPSRLGVDGGGELHPRGAKKVRGRNECLYRVFRDALHVVMACQAYKCADQGWEVFTFCLGFTVSRLGFDEHCGVMREAVERGDEVNAGDSVERGGMRRVGGF